MKIGIIGDGAMGCLFGAWLSQKNDVVIFGRSESRSNKLKLRGVNIEESNTVEHFNPMCGIYSERFGSFELLVLLVKSSALENVLASIKDKIGPETFVLCIQSGAGLEHIIEKYVDRSRILLGVTKHCVSIVQTGELCHEAAGETFIGFPFAEEAACDEHCSLFLTVLTLNFILCGIETKTVENIGELVWQNLIIEATAGVASALIQCELGHISKDEYAWSIAEKLLDEAVTTGHAEGYTLDLAFVREQVRNFSKQNPNSYSLIYKNIKSRKKTEIDCISGYIAACAKKHDLQVPCTEFVVNQIHALENQIINKSTGV